MIKKFLCYDSQLEADAAMKLINVSAKVLEGNVSSIVELPDGRFGIRVSDTVEAAIVNGTQSTIYERAIEEVDMGTPQQEG